jgi:hypothetical protein
MKSFYQTLLLLSFLLFSGGAYAQFYNFDGVPSGSVGTLNNGWVGTPGTNTVFSWRADVNGTGSGGTGPAVDHTLGTAAGVYMYTEASAPATLGDTALLESPNISLASFTSPALVFWYHKAGGSMGNLYVDIFNGTTWVRGVDSIIGSTQATDIDPWLRRSINIGSFSGTIKVRFRAVCGAGFASDMAIDDVGIEELPAYDLKLSNASLLPVRYVQYPLPQSTNISFSADVTNVGGLSLTNPTLRVTVGGWQDSASVATLASGASTNLTTTNFPIQPVGDYTALFETYAVENDSNPGDNTATLDFTVSDSIYARDDSTATGSLGIGPGVSGTLGQIFDVVVQDTLTSASFFLNNPGQGDTTFVTLHPFTTQPGVEIASSDTLFIPVAGPGWYTVNFACPQILTPGVWFLGVHELDANITLGTTPFNYQPNTSWVIFGANAWAPSEAYNFLITYLLRANFGDVNTSVNAGAGSLDSICVSSGMVDLSTLISGNDPGGAWNDDNGTGALSGTMVDPTVTGVGTFTFSYGVSDNCGFSDSTSVILVVTPSGNAGADSTLMNCDFDGSFDLTPFLGTADPGGTWSDDNSSGALTGSNFDPSSAGPGMWNFTYTVTAPGCGPETATITVDVVVCPAIDPAVPLSFTIYPNPNNGHFRMDAPGSLGQNLEIRIMDLAGREVYTEAVYNASGNLEINLSDVSRGMYIVELNNGDAKTQGRLIKE